MISEGVMWDLIDKYENVVTIFDNDEAGKKAVEKYKERYGITGFSIDLEKDVSDSIKKYGKEAVKAELVPLLIESIHTCRRCSETSTLV
jgi:DNA primase